MFARQSRLLYSFFHKSDPSSKKHGGELVAKVIKSHGIDNIFYLAGGHVSPIVVASNKLDINIVDVRHEATAVFAADASARLTGLPGVAVVTAGPGLTNTVTAIKNAQMAESPVVVIAGAAATKLKGRGSLQDIDQVSLLQSATKKCFSVDCVRDITPTLREAFRVAQVGVPGPVLVELPVDILYPYEVTAVHFNSMSSKNSTGTTKKPSIKSRIIQAYSNYSLNHIFADAWKDQDFDPMPVTVKHPAKSQIKQAAELLKEAKRPLILIGSQSILKPHGPESIIENVKRLGIPVYLNGAARGLMGSDYSLQFRHARKEAVRESDCVLLLGAICDFRLSYGRIFGKQTKVISVNRSASLAKLNSGIFWSATVAVESDVGQFLDCLTKYIAANEQATNDPNNNNVCESLIDFDRSWLDQLNEREKKKDKDIEMLASLPTEKYLNPLKLLLEVKRQFANDDSILVADGGDFVSSASYIMKPNGPLRWLDPGPFGTLGCGAGFALAAKILNPDKKVIAIMGDGAFGYAISELDTFVRHKVPVYWVIGNDAAWTQIEREQVPLLGSSIGCKLAYTDYHKVAQGFGAKGFKLDSDKEIKHSSDNVIEKSKLELEKTSTTVVVNALIGNTKFRDGSISV